MARTAPRGELFPALLRHWRTRRGLSQLDLAIAAGVSSRHVSFLETGRSVPSAAMVLRLGSALDVPLRHVNAMLRAAGHDPRFPEPSPGEALPERVRAAIDLMKRHHEPFPLIVVDRAYRVVDLNDGARALLGTVLAGLAAFGPEPSDGSAPASDAAPDRSPSCPEPSDDAPSGPARSDDDTPAGPAGAPSDVPSDVPDLDLARFVFDPDLGGRAIANHAEVARELVWRMQRELLADPDNAPLRRLLDDVLGRDGVDPDWRAPDLAAPSAPSMELRLRVGDAVWSFVLMMTAVQAPQEVVLQELRIESWFPADEATATGCGDLLGSLGSQTEIP